MVKRLGDHPELPDVLHTSEPLVRFVHHTLHQLGDFGLLGEVSVGGVRNFFAGGPVAHDIELDTDQGCQVFSAVSNDHGLLDVGGGLETVLYFGRRDVLSARSDDDVLHPIDDLDVCTVDPLTDIARPQPAVLGKNLGRLLRLVPVALENCGVLGLYLPGLLVDPQSDAGIRGADRPHLVRPWKVARRHRGVLGHAIQLKERDSHTEEVLDQLRCNRCRPNGGVTNTPHPDALFQSPKHNRITDEVEESTQERMVTIVGHPLGTDDRYQLHPESKPDSLEPGAVPAPDDDAGMNSFQDARNGKEKGGLNLPKVLLDGLDRLGEVECAPESGHMPRGKDALCDMTQRQVGENRVGWVGRLPRYPVFDTHQVFDTEQEVGVGEHRSLRRAGGA